MSHTKGPWFVEGYEKTPIYVSPVDRHERIAICNVFVIDECPSESGDWINGDETKANARLIAASPNVLRAAKRYLEFRHLIDVGMGCDYTGIHPETDLKQAIAEAEGHQ